jgi:hypothetical protein
VEADKVVRYRGSHIFYTIVSQMAVRLSQPYATAALYPQEDSWYSFLLEAESIPRSIVRLEGLGQLKNPMTSPRIEPATLWLVA